MKRLSLVLCIVFAAIFLVSCSKTHPGGKGSPAGEMKGSPKGADCCVEEKGSPAEEKKGS